MIARALVLFFLLWAQLSWAKIDVLFHPYDLTLNRIAEDFSQAKSSIDIAMYNMDVTDKSPLIKMLKTPEMQTRILSGQLQIRIILEGSGTALKKQEKMNVLESLGVDARFLSSGLNVHHKFAVIDAAEPVSKLITGSANWSVSSMQNYNENILFVESEPALTYQFAREFLRLWNAASEFGSRSSEPSLGTVFSPVANPVAYFNSAHFQFAGKSVTLCPTCESYTLTRQVVAAIESAKSSLQIATTRIRLRPVYDALKAAAARGVKVEAVVSMDSYESPYYRKNAPVGACSNPYEGTCSQGVNFATALAEDEYPGRENVNIRFKYYDLVRSNYITKQMHSKYMVVDKETVLTGSFNWSHSSEYSHLENLVLIQDKVLAARYELDFERIFNGGRGGELASLKTTILKALEEKSTMSCSFTPVAMGLFEIDELYGLIRSAKKTVADVCGASTKK